MKLLVYLLPLLLATNITHASPPLPRGQANIEAPDDVYVTQISSRQERAGPDTVLLVLRSPSLLFWRVTLDSQARQLETDEKKYNINGYAAAHLTDLQQKVASLTEAKDYSTTLVSAIGVLVSAGTLDVMEVWQAQHDDAVVEATLIDAKIKLQQEAIKQREEQVKIKARHQKASNEDSLFCELNSHLAVRIPTATTFKAIVRLGDFVKKGDVLGQVTYSSNAVASSAGRIFNIEAPDDVYVTDAASEGHVSKGTTLFSLNSPMLAYWHISLSSQEAEIDASEQKYLNGDASEQIRLLTEKLAALTSAAKFGQDYANKASNVRDTGAGGNNVDANRALKNVKTDVSVVTEAKIKLDQEVNRQDEERAKIVSQRQKLAGDEALYKEMLLHLTVTINQNASFKTFVAVGSFLRKGHILGQVRY